MKKILALAALLACTLVNAQTTIIPGGAIFDDATGSFIGFQNRSTGREEVVKIKGQARTFQTTAPTFTTNCGTSPSITGTDSAMIVTMGATGVPASAWVVTFNGTWGAVPSCVAQMALSSMANTKLPIALVVTTTTITVTTNGAAPATSDKYAILCMGVS